MTRTGDATPPPELLADAREQERIRIGHTLYEALYNRIYDPQNEMTDAEEKEIEPIVARMEREESGHELDATRQLYRKYKRFEINKFRLRWFSGGINWIAVVRREGHLPFLASDKIKTYQDGYLSSVIEQAKQKRLFDPLDIRVADCLLERTLDGMFPTIRELRGDSRKQELERLTNASFHSAIDQYIDVPEAQKKYEGFTEPDPVYFDKDKLNALLDTIQIIKNGFYLPPILTEKVTNLAIVLRKEIKKKRWVDILDASIARILVEQSLEELERLILYNRAEAEAEGEGEATQEKRTASLQVHVLESFSDRITSILSSP